MECIAEIDLLSSFGHIFLNSLFFMNLRNQLYIIAPFCFELNYEILVFYNLKGIKTKEIKIKTYSVFDTNYYYDQKAKKNYIFFCGFGFVKSFDFNKNNIYKIYCNNEGIHNDKVAIYDKDKKIKLISSGEGIVRIWNFHSGDLLNKLKIYNNRFELPKICIWNSDYLIGACEENGLKIFDFKNENIPQTMSGFGKSRDVKKIMHPVYGDCLLILSKDKNTNLYLGINKYIL